jgi:hypothetical protein
MKVMAVVAAAAGLAWSSVVIGSPDMTSMDPFCGN